MSSGPSRESLDQLFSLAYEELRCLARGVLRPEAKASLSPTTLVNEAWLRLASSPEVAHTSALHFRRIAGRVMRHLLVDAARRRCAAIHGGGQVRLALDEALGFGQILAERDVLALDAALETLNGVAPRQALLVEARFFGGYSCEECAALLGISEATAMRDWRAARAWLATDIKRHLYGDAGSKIGVYAGETG